MNRDARIKTRAGRSGDSSGVSPLRGIVLILAVLLAACSAVDAVPPISTPTASPMVSPIEAVGTNKKFTRTPLPTERDFWPDLLQHTPVPWTTPLPPLEPTLLDGLYVKNDPSEPQWWNCLRCADYLPSGGIWRLMLDRGIFRIYYTEVSWRSLGSYTVEGDRIYLFNDPYCQWDVGVYTWNLEDGKLRFNEVDDPCSTSFRLRAANLTKQEWLTCSPGEGEEPPEGCPMDPGDEPQ